MLTGSIVISGPANIAEPVQPGPNTSAQVQISLTQYGYGDSGSVHWQTESVAGGATSGVDFFPDSGTVYLSYANTSVYVNIPILYDGVSEPPEPFRVVLSSATGSLAIMVESWTIDIVDYYGSPPPPPPPPQAPTVAFTTAAPEPMTEGDIRVLHLIRSTATQPLTVYYTIPQNSVATSADVTLTPAGSVSFAAGQTTATITLEAVDDSLIEVHEVLRLALVSFPAPNQGPGAYIVGDPGEVAVKISDNTELIFSDLTVDWRLDEETWVDSSGSEMLWQEDELRWTVTLPAEEVPFRDELEHLQLLKRPHGYPGTPWEAVTPQSFQANPDNLAEFFIYANPGVGDWDVTVLGIFDAAINAWLVAPKRQPVEGIVSTKWVRPVADPELRLGTDLEDAVWMAPPHFGPRIYPEYTLPPEHVLNQKDHTKVDVEVTLAMPVPAGFAADLYLKDYDVDNVFNATRSEDVGSGYHDPNDEILDNPFYPDPAPSPIGTDNSKTLKRWPNDNRDGSGGLAKGGALDTGHIAFQPTETVRTVGYTISLPQPGNNYRVSVSGHPEIIARHALAKDGITVITAPLIIPKFGTEGGVVPAIRVTDTLTVWRTLHIERDSMGPPPMNEVFDPAQPFDDLPPDPLDVRDADISMLYEWFVPANIAVVADLFNYDVKDGANPNFFMHNIEDPDFEVGPPSGSAFSKIRDMRDVANSASFWSVQVIGAYEGRVNSDFDDPQPENATFGSTSNVAENPFSIIYLETIRDFTAFVSYVTLQAYPPTFGSNSAERALILEMRTTVHEVAHTFIGAHTGNPGDASETAIMGEDPMLYGTDAENRFTAKQLGLLQSRTRPNANGAP